VVIDAGDLQAGQGARAPVQRERVLERDAELVVLQPVEM